MSDKTFLTTGEAELDEETERLMWEYRVASRSAATVVAANALRSRIRHLVEEAIRGALDCAYGDGQDDVGFIG